MPVATETALIALGREVAELRAEVSELVALVRREDPARLLSMREASRRLGVSRSRTLPALVREGRIRTVVVNGRNRIPSDEIRRIQQEGTAEPRGRRSGQRGPSSSPARAPLARDLV